MENQHPLASVMNEEEMEFILRIENLKKEDMDSQVYEIPVELFDTKLKFIFFAERMHAFGWLALEHKFNFKPIAQYQYLVYFGVNMIPGYDMTSKFNESTAFDVAQWELWGREAARERMAARRGSSESE